MGTFEVCIVTNYSDDRKGGAARQARELANCLAADGRQVAFVCRTPLAARSDFNRTVCHYLWAVETTPGRAKRVIESVRRLFCRTLTPLCRLWIAALDRRPLLAPSGSTREDLGVIAGRCLAGQKAASLARVLGQIDARCVISFITNANVCVSLALWYSDVRVVTSERSNLEDPTRSAFWDQLERFTSRRPDVLTANTRESLRQLDAAHRVNRGEVRVAPNIARMDGTATPVARRFLAFGQLLPRKQVERIIAAFAHFREDLAGWELVIAGDGPEQQRLRRVASDAGVAERTTFLGHVDDVGALLSRGGILVMASSHEGTPNSLMEAMAFGLPSIVPQDLLGAVDLISAGGHAPAGILVADRSPVTLGSAMVNLAHDEAVYRQLAEAARSRSELLAWDRVRTSWNDIAGIISH